MKKETLLLIKGLFESCLVFLLVLGVIISIFIGVFIVSFALYEDNPGDDYYICRMEFIANDTLPSCKVIKQKYHDDVCTRAVIKLSVSDYNKVLNAVQTDSTFKVFDDQEHPYSLFCPWPEEIEKLMKKENITFRNIDVKYDGGSTGLGFVPPNIIVFNQKH